MARERDTGRTRRRVLDAAMETVGRLGAGASVDAVARAAGVSKGGLLHHFGSRDALLRELAEDGNAQFRAAVEAAVDPRDHAPGRLTRAYVTVVFDELLDEQGVVEHFRLMTALVAVPGVQELLAQDAARWDRAFADDGLSPERSLLVVRATDGAATAALLEGPDPVKLDLLREVLLTLTRGDDVPGARPDGTG